MAARIGKLEGAAATRDVELSIPVWAVQSPKRRATAGEDGSSTAEARARDTWDKMSDLRALVAGLNRTVGSERARIAGLFGTEL